VLHEIPSLSDFTSIAPYLSASITAIGNFDGIHRGHRKIISYLTAATSTKVSLPSVLLTFNPRPAAFFQQLSQSGVPQVPDNLFTSAQKKRAAAELGISYLLEQEFTAAFCRLSPEQFYQQILRRYLAAQSIVIGNNFYFGHKRAGSPPWLKEHTTQDGLDLKIIKPSTSQGAIISSTRIRAALHAAKVEAAEELLGRPYLLEGTSIPGSQLGRRIGIPTINIAADAQLVPREGVYAGYVWLALKTAPPIFPQLSQLIPAVFNIGVRQYIRHIEAHLLRGNYPQEMYNTRCGFYFCHFLRDEKTFGDTYALRQQIELDIGLARQKLGLL
jgi:riboflavin kinase/FMN adenylyltransferase